ncbi:MAG: hypothetical protein XD62_0610 [Methanosarcinales archeaon 56_1174]|uniref:hypothetical protein n=1 Tax=Methermicoccus shengliensis TaxID=660064 RepID=UPI00076D2266|nr:hypothetical protein [Methermicoccus shengliensis]KUK30263.1 MAG: hypothetical protein XD62_0610 [Methanosarcinales archeaon 56_1174]
MGFYSVNPNPLDNPSKNNIKSTPGKGFLRIDYIELYNILKQLIKEDKEFFSSMIPKVKLGKIIEISNKEPTYERKAEKFLKMLRGIGDE